MIAARTPWCAMAERIRPLMRARIGVAPAVAAATYHRPSAAHAGHIASSRSA
jgi:hypothetical protein